MARPFWKGAISFGLVEIPVSLRPAVRSQELGFSLIDKNDFSPVGYRRYNKRTGEEVPYERIVRGYEYEPGEYVVLTDEELRRANPKASQTIEIVQFVDREEIDTLYFETAYLVEPLKADSKSYALLREALHKTGKAGIAKLVLRTRQHLAALVVRDDVLVLNLLHFSDEVVALDDVQVPAKNARAVAGRELEMATRLVEGMTDRWNPGKFKDDYREDVLALVKRKVKSGQTHAIVEAGPEGEEAPAREVVDLMPLLKRSVDQAARGGGTRPRAAHPERKPAAARGRAAPARRHATARQRHSA